MYVWIYIDNKLAKFHRNVLGKGENIAESFFGGGATFFTHTVEFC